jgi:outer membrane protein
MKNKTNNVVRIFILAGAQMLANIAVAQSIGLQDSYRLASQHDAVFAQARAQHDAAQYTVSQGLSLLLPQVQANGSLAKTNSSLERNNSTTQVLSLTANQALFNKEAFVRYKQAKNIQTQADITFKQAKNDLIIRVSNAYFAVLLAQQDLSLAHAKEKADMNQLEQATVSVEVGQVSPVDALQAQSNYDLSKANRISSKNLLDVRKALLSNLTGEPLTTLLDFLPHNAIASALFNLEENDLKEWRNKASTQNLQVLSLEQSLEISRKEIGAQQAGHWPTVSLQVQYSRTSFPDVGTPNLFLQENNNFRISVDVSVPIYSGGLVQNQVAEARDKKRQAFQGLRNAREQASLNASVQFVNLSQGKILVEALQQAVKSSDLFLEATEESYKVGLTTLLEVLSARTLNFQAKRNLFEAVYNVMSARLEFDSSVGELSPERLVEFDRVTNISEANSFNEN